MERISRSKFDGLTDSQADVNTHRQTDRQTLMRNNRQSKHEDWGFGVKPKTTMLHQRASEKTQSVMGEEYIFYNIHIERYKVRYPRYV